MICSAGVITARLSFRLDQALVGNHDNALMTNSRFGSMAAACTSTAIPQTLSV